MEEMICQTWVDYSLLLTTHLLVKAISSNGPIPDGYGIPKMAVASVSITKVGVRELPYSYRFNCTNCNTSISLKSSWCLERRMLFDPEFPNVLLPRVAICVYPYSPFPGVQRGACRVQKREGRTSLERNISNATSIVFGIPGRIEFSKLHKNGPFVLPGFVYHFPGEFPARIEAIR